MLLVLLQGNEDKHLQTIRTKKKKRMKMKLEKEIISADLEKLKSASVQMSQTIDLLEKRFLEGIEMAEKNNEMSLVIRGNCLKRKSIEIKSDLKLLLKEYGKLKEKNKEIIVILKAGIYDLYLFCFF